MEIKKINIKSCEIGIDKGTYKTYKILDIDGNKYGSTQEFSEGEHEVEVTINGVYTNIKKVAQKKPFIATQKDWTFEKKKVAIEVAEKIHSVKLDTDTYSTDNVLASAEKIYKWINS